MRYWSLLTFVFVLSVAKSQGISGVVVDEKNEPVAYAISRYYRQTTHHL